MGISVPAKVVAVGNELAIAWDDGREDYLPFEMLRRNWTCAMCRTRSPEKSETLPEGARGVVGDLEKPESLPAALNGVDRVVLVTPLHPHEAQLGRNAVEAARKAAVRRLVYVSIHDVEK